MSFGVLVLILVSFIFDLFVHVDWVSVYSSWYFSSVWLKIVCGVYPNRTYGFSSPADLRKVTERVPIRCNCLLKLIIFFLIKNILQFLYTIIPLLIVALYILYLLYQRLLTLKPVPGCDCKFSVGYIQTGHVYLLPPKFCGMLWQGCWLRGCILHHQLIESLKVNRTNFFLLIVVWWVLAVEEEVPSTYIYL